MATYYTNLNNQRDATPMLYLREPLPCSQVETSAHPGNAVYMNPGSFSDTLVSSSQQPNNCITLPSPGGLNSNTHHHDILSNLGGGQIGEHDFTGWRGGRDEMLVLQPLDGHASLLQNGQNLQGQGLSLSLGTQIPSAIQTPGHPYRNPNLGLASFLSPHPSLSGESGGRNSSRDEQSRNAEYALQSFPVGNPDANKGNLSPYGMSGMARIIPDSRYLKAAQQLLDEVVNVRKALKQPDEKNKDMHENQIKKSDEGNEGLKNDASSNGKESEGNSQTELSHAERQDLQNKLTKLLSMLDEVDRRYKQYYHQMQIVVSSFDAIAGHGAAKPYTALALQTISCHFRCLRDAISGQIQATRKSLGDQDASGNGKGVGIARLRYVDQQLRQQRALQQLGMMQQHAWRPQRGLPESSVSILRAWLFEHFLHPYPKDSDKIMLARQTGLTRSQVSNWFINARVRLWKPMVEEMYKEEIGDADLDSISSSETAVKAKKSDAKSSEDRTEELQQCSTHMDRSSSGQFLETKSDNAPDIEMVRTSGGVGPQNVTHGDFRTEHGTMKLTGLRRPSLDDSGLFSDSIIQSEAGNDRFMAAAAAAYHMSDMARFGGGSGVSLTLGLQHSDCGSLPMSGGTHHGFFSMRGDDMYDTGPSSVGTVTTEFDGVDIGNQQHRFSSGHLMHDFVA